jgi:hypothetical protein
LEIHEKFPMNRLPAKPGLFLPFSHKELELCLVTGHLLSASLCRSSLDENFHIYFQ